MCLRPTPIEFEDNKAKALWKFATANARHIVRKGRWSWEYFKERRDNRRRFLELGLRFLDHRSPGDEGYEEWLRRRRAIAPTDARLYVDMLNRRQNTTPVHK